MPANTRKKYYLEKANTKLFKIQQVSITFNKIVYTLSVLANWRLEVKKHFDVTKNCFYPKPKITSTVLSFVPKKKNKFILKNPHNLETITRVLFSNRRKMINKNLYKLFKKKQNLIKKLNIDLRLRVDQLNSETIYKIAVLYENLYN